MLIITVSNNSLPYVTWIKMNNSVYMKSKFVYSQMKTTEDYTIMIVLNSLVNSQITVHVQVPCPVHKWN